VFGFELRPLTLRVWNLKLEIAGASRQLPHPVPALFARISTPGVPRFWLGMNSDQGWWYYFPVAFALKTPLPTLILLGAAIVAALAECRRWKSRQVGKQVWRGIGLLSFPLIYFAIALTQPFNIGYRHLLPILPFVFVFISQISNVKRHLVLLSPRFLVWVLLSWYAIGTIRIFPHYLAYFNEIAGGPANWLPVARGFPTWTGGRRGRS